MIMNEEILINCEGFGNFIYLGSTSKLHRFNTNGVLVHETVVIRNISGESTMESAKESLETYLRRFGKALLKKSQI